MKRHGKAKAYENATQQVTFSMENVTFGTTLHKSYTFIHTSFFMFYFKSILKILQKRY